MEVENGYVVLKVPPENSKDLTIGKAEEKRVCEVCGYANDKYAQMCKKCSNYITGGTR